MTAKSVSGGPDGRDEDEEFSREKIALNLPVDLYHGSNEPVLNTILLIKK